MKAWAGGFFSAQAGQGKLRDKPGIPLIGLQKNRKCRNSKFVLGGFSTGYEVKNKKKTKKWKRYQPLSTKRWENCMNEGGKGGDNGGGEKRSVQ